MDQVTGRRGVIVGHRRRARLLLSSLYRLFVLYNTAGKSCHSSTTPQTFNRTSPHNSPLSTWPQLLPTP